MERWKCWNPSGTGISFSPLKSQERIRIRGVGRKAGDLRPMVYSQNPLWIFFSTYRDLGGRIPPTKPTKRLLTLMTTQSWMFRTAGWLVDACEIIGWTNFGGSLLVKKTSERLYKTPRTNYRFVWGLAQSLCIPPLPE